MFLFLNTYAPSMLLKLNVLNVILDTYVYCSQRKKHYWKFINGLKLKLCMTNISMMYNQPGRRRQEFSFGGL